MSEQPTPTSTSPQAAGFRNAHLELRRAQKSAKGAPAYSLFVNRPLGRIIAAAAFQIGLTPNQVTLLSALSTFAGIVGIALASPTYGQGLLLAALLVLGYALDSADGQLARLRGGGSLAGEWLDHFFDAVKTPALHLAVLVFAYRNLDGSRPLLLLVPLVFAVVATTAFFAIVLNDLMVARWRVGHPSSTAATAGASRPTALRALLKLPADYGVLCLVFVFLGTPPLFSVLYGLLALGTILYLAVAIPAWYQNVRRLDSA